MVLLVGMHLDLYERRFQTEGSSLEGSPVKVTGHPWVTGLQQEWPRARQQQVYGKDARRSCRTMGTPLGFPAMPREVSPKAQGNGHRIPT